METDHSSSRKDKRLSSRHTRRFYGPEPLYFINDSREKMCMTITQIFLLLRMRKDGLDEAREAQKITRT